MSDELFKENLIEEAIEHITNESREKHFENIFQLKYFIHQCQTKCYSFREEETKNKQKSLKEAEECSRECFKPLLYAKTNISKIHEGLLEKFNECKFQAIHKGKENKRINDQITKCLKEYKNDLESKFNDIDYIYKGYLKNFTNI